MLHSSHKTLLLPSKNLLAFSAGVDSSALFFLMIENAIPFDIALVNYDTREASDKEEKHAKALAEEYHLTCHSIKAPAFHTHFEQQARDFRYQFFETLCKVQGYDTLLTAHQLNDQLEWLLMRLSKGAGVSELIGMEPVVQKQHYTLVRPLLSYSKEELLSYLKKHSYPYFIDESNEKDTYERNRFRKQFSDPLISQYREGIKRSFDYLRRDKATLEEEFETVYRKERLYIIKLHSQAIKARAADITLKSLGYLLSAAQREEIATEASLVIGGKWAIVQQNNLLYIAPYITIEMPKRFKEQYRVARIPVKIRPYLYQENIDPKLLISNF